jgi:hypothetical protein
MYSSCDWDAIKVPEPWLGEEPIVSNDTAVTVDLAKSFFELAGSHRLGQVSRRERLAKTPRASSS